MSDLITTKMLYTQKYGDRMEPEGVQLEAAKRIMSQLSGILSEEVIRDAHVREDGVMLTMRFGSRFNHCGDDESYSLEALLTWDILLNGDIIAWHGDVEQADKDKKEQKAIEEKLRVKEAQAREAERRAENQRQADLATYERIKAEVNAAQEAGREAEKGNVA